MSNRGRDGTAEAVGCVFWLLGILTAITVGLVARVIREDRNKPRLPSVPEPPPDYRPPPLLSTLIFQTGAGAFLAFLAILALDEPNAWVTNVFCGGPAAILLGLAFFGWNAREKLRELRNEQGGFLETPRRYTVVVPSGTAWQPEVAQRFVESVVRTIPQAVLRIVAEAGEIRWEILDWRAGVPHDSVQQTVRAYYPDAVITLEDSPSDAGDYPFYRYVLLFQQAAEFVWPIQYADDLKDFDPLIGIVRTMASLREGERIIYTLALSVLAPYAYDVGEKMITTAAPSQIHPYEYMSVWGTPLGLIEASLYQTRQDKYRATDQNVALSKLAHPLVQCNLAIQIDSPHPERVEQLADIDTQVWQFENSYNALVWISEELSASLHEVTDEDSDVRTAALGTVRRCVRGQDRRWPHARLIMTPAELAALWHLPHEEFDVPHITWLKGLQRAAPKEILQRMEGMLLGDNVYRGQEAPVYLAEHDRATHAAMFGKTGTGKSTLMHHLIHQDIAAGRGVAVLDPHGTLIDNLLAASIPKERKEDVVLLECGNDAYPVPLNPFRVPDGIPVETAYNYLYWVLRKIYAGIWLEGQTNRVIQHVLRTLLCDPNATPLDIERLLIHGGYRASLIDMLQEQGLRSSLMFWKHYNEQSEGTRSNMTQPVLNRTEVFLGSPAIEYMTCHPNTLDFQALIRDRKVVLINLAGKTLRTEVDNLGALFMAGFYMASEALGYIPDGDPPRFYLYIDEVERYVTSPIPDMFSEARKLGMSLLLANQYLDQLSRETLNGILGNAGTLLAFEVGDKDATTLRGAFAPELDTHALQNIGKYHVAVKTRAHALTLPAFTVRTRQPLPKGDPQWVESIRTQSIETNGLLPAEEVDAWLDRRYHDVGEPEVDATSHDDLGNYE